MSTATSKPTTSRKPAISTKPQPSEKPVISSASGKPALKTKPSIKPRIKTKPTSVSDVSKAEDRIKPETSSVATNQTSISVTPAVSSQPVSGDDVTVTASSLHSDDISNYILENSAHNDDDIDLFSWPSVGSDQTVLCNQATRWVLNWGLYLTSLWLWRYGYYLLLRVKLWQYHKATSSMIKWTNHGLSLSIFQYSRHSSTTVRDATCKTTSFNISTKFD